MSSVDSCVSSTSELKSVLCHHRKYIKEVQIHHLGEQCQAAVRDILGAFFLERNLCDRVFAELGFDEFTPVETAHFRTFSLFWQSGTFEEFESEWEDLDQVEATEFQETRVLTACASAPRSYEDALAQRMEIRRGLRLIQGYGVIGNGDFAFDETDWHWRRRDSQG